MTCERAGGRYMARGAVPGALARLDEIQKAKLTTWIFDRNRAGEDFPEISNDILTSVISKPTLSVSARIDGLLVAFSEVHPNVGAIGRLHDNRFLVASQSVSENDVEALWDFVVEAGWGERVRKPGSGFPPKLTGAGFRHVDELLRKNRDSNQGFIARWFDDEMLNAGQAMRSAVEDAGFRPMDLNVEHFDNHINDKIISELRRSRFAVVDLTCPVTPEKRPLVRGSVYFEAGFAMGVGIPVIWTCRKDRMDGRHFDVEQFPTLSWLEPNELREKLRDRITAIVRDGADKRQNGV